MDYIIPLLLFCLLIAYAISKFVVWAVFKGIDKALYCHKGMHIPGHIEKFSNGCWHSTCKICSKKIKLGDNNVWVLEQ